MRTLLILLLVASPAFAGNRYCATCKPVYHAPAAVIAQPQTIIENQQVFYPTAPYAQYPVTDAAMQLAQAEEIKYSMQALTDKVAALQSRQAQPQMIVVYPQIQMQQQQAACADGTCQTPQAEQPPKFNQTASVMQSCIKCHTKAGAARDALDLTKAISCDDALNAMEAVAVGTMPKGGKPFTPEQLTQLRKELGEFNKRFEKPETPPQQPPNEAPKEDPEEKFSALPAETQRQLLALIQKK